MLARLARKPASGYDLLQGLKKPIGFFWQAGQSQIYPELKRLEVLELVTFELVKQYDRPDKKVYAITEQGRTALQKWAVAPVEPEPNRSELLLKVYSFWLADPEKALKLIQTHADLHAALLLRHERTLAAIHEEHPAPIKISEPLFGDYATLQMGVRYEREYVDWCRWLSEQLEQYVRDQNRPV